MLQLAAGQPLPASFPRGPICMILMLSRSHSTGQPGRSPHWAGARADQRQAQGGSLARDWPEFGGPLFLRLEILRPTVRVALRKRDIKAWNPSLK